jgi:hypothetical protein
MEGFIKFTLRILIFCCFFSVNAQLKNGIHFKYRSRDFVVFEYSKEEVNLDFLSWETMPFEPSIYNSFKILDLILKELNVKKGEVVQLYFYKDMNMKNHVYITLLEKRILRIDKTYKTELVYPCLGDCKDFNKLMKVYILDIDTSKLIRMD